VQSALEGKTLAISLLSCQHLDHHHRHVVHRAAVAAEGEEGVLDGLRLVGGADHGAVAVLAELLAGRDGPDVVL
jgi:hypothetical protein